MWLFRRNYASRNNDRRTAASLNLACKPIRQRRGRGKFQVVFQIAADPDTVRRRAECPDPLRIFLTLHQESPRIGQRALQKRAQEKTEHSEIALVACKGPVRDASADENDGNLAPPGFPKKIRPDLRLEHQHNRRLHGIECAPNAKSPIQRKVDNGVGKCHALTRQRLARDRGRRDDEKTIGVGFFQPSRKSNAGKRFTDAHCVYPDRARGMWG